MLGGRAAAMAEHRELVNFTHLVETSGLRRLSYPCGSCNVWMRNKENCCGVDFDELSFGGWKMKRLSLLALSALLLVGSTTAVSAQGLTGSLLIENTGRREIPAGSNEIGRYARFMTDERMYDRYEMQLSNRDYENWKPLDVRSKEKMSHFMSGDLRMNHPIIGSQPVGRFARFVTNEPMMYNNMWFENRDFENYKVNGATSRNAAGHFLRGLSAGTNLVPVGNEIRIGARGSSLWY